MRGQALAAFGIVAAFDAVNYAALGSMVDEYVDWMSRAWTLCGDR